MIAAPNVFVQVEACPRCAHPSAAAAQFCEQCGQSRLDLPRAAVRSHVGSVRPTNQDAAVLCVLDGSVTAVVCDGVASASHADAAARDASVAAAGAIRRSGLASAVGAAMGAVSAIPFAAGAEPPACTLVAARVTSGCVELVSVGDSRAYWFDGEGVVTLTADHAIGHDLTRWIGIDADVESIECQRHVPREAGWLVLCTDGVWNMVDMSDIAHAAAGLGPGDAATLADLLVDRALSAGGLDNITAVVVRVEP